MPKSKTKKTKKNISIDKKDIKKISDKVDTLEKSLVSHKEKNILLLAEFDNYKKRKIQERIDYEKYEGRKIFKEVIPIIDDIDRVLSLDGIKDHSLVDGISLIREKFIGVLNDFGVLSYDSVGEKFDPEYHEAIMMKKIKGKSNIVIEEFQKGYKYHDKVLRHSKVIVSE
tara:strand:+ start:40049 stop:40558 length:510 start_codon:yes stop_codon:yes gene_type:complete